jgi:hypothetical protein
MKSKEEIEKSANEFSKDYIKTTNNSILQSSFKLEVGYIKGYTQCQEDMADEKYTEEDIREAIDMARMVSHVSCLEEGEHRLKYSNTEEDIINSLNKQDNEK